MTDYEFLFWLLVALCALTIIFCCFRRRKLPWRFHAKVVWVCDGDSVWVRTWYGRRIKLRILGIDAPETEQAYGKEATDLLGRLIQNRSVEVEAVDRDIYGRLVSSITCNGKDVSLEMLKRGAAWPYFRYFRNVCPVNASLYKAAYEDARGARRGLWSQSDPEAPWDWRVRHRSIWSRFVYWLKQLLGLTRSR